LSVLLAKANGTLKPALVISGAGGNGGANLVTGDFNNDGKTDVALANFTGGVVDLLLGNGDGTFQAPVGIPCPIHPSALSTGDFNKDQKLDLAVISSDYGGTLVIMTGNGDGTFGESPVYYMYDRAAFSGSTLPNSIETADINLDGNPDLVIGLGNSHDLVGGCCQPGPNLGLMVFLGNGDGTMTQNTANGPFLAGAYSRGGLAIADFNGDGAPDAAVTNSDGNFSYVTVLINAELPVSVSPRSITYPTQLIGTASAAKTVVLTNNSGAPLAFTGIKLQGAHPGDFVLASECGKTLAAGSHCTVSVTFKPAGLNARTTSLVIIDNIGTQAVALSGTGTEVKLKPATLNFGGVGVGQTSTPMTVTVTNEGSASMNFVAPGIAITGFDPADFSETTTCGSTLGSMASCSIHVTFTPKATGARQASLSIQDNGGGSPQKVSMSGTGE
jgi:hypothetical protein